MRNTLLAFSLAGICSVCLPAFSQTENSLILSLAGVASGGVNKSGELNSGENLDYGGGLLVEAEIDDHFGIEMGLLMLERSFENSDGVFKVSQSIERLHVPLLARFWLADIFSVAVGPFVEFKTGTKKTTFSVGDIDVGSVESSVDDQEDFGIDLAATLNLAINDKSGIFIEGRYSDFFSNQSNQNTNKAFALAGLKIDL